MYPEQRAPGLKVQFGIVTRGWNELNVTLSDKLQKCLEYGYQGHYQVQLWHKCQFPPNRLHWDNLSTRRKKPKAMSMFKTIRGLSPANLQNIFSTRSTPYNLRDWELKLDLYKPRKSYCNRGFGYRGSPTEITWTLQKRTTVSQSPTRQSFQTVWS